MSYHECYTCDVCGVEKLKMNHWFEALQTVSPARTLLLSAFFGNRGGGVEHICSSACLAKRVQQFEESLRELQKGS